MINRTRNERVTEFHEYRGKPCFDAYAGKPVEQIFPREAIVIIGALYGITELPFEISNQMDGEIIALRHAMGIEE